MDRFLDEQENVSINMPFNNNSNTLTMSNPNVQINVQQPQQTQNNSSSSNHHSHHHNHHHHSHHHNHHHGMNISLQQQQQQQSSSSSSSSSNNQRLFNEVIRANIGDCHAMGQRPLTFLRQVLACSSDDSLLTSQHYPNDVKERTRLMLKYCGGQSVGAYSDSAGVEIIRKHCAEYVSHRDGIESEWRDIVLTTGASEGIRSILALINTCSTDSLPSGVMIPIPQYPLYSATITEYGMYPINYYLDEG